MRDLGAATTTLKVTAETNKWEMAWVKCILMFDKGCIECINHLLHKAQVEMGQRVKGSNDSKWAAGDYIRYPSAT